MPIITKPRQYTSRKSIYQGRSGPYRRQKYCNLVKQYNPNCYISEYAFLADYSTVYISLDSIADHLREDAKNLNAKSIYLPICFYVKKELIKTEVIYRWRW